MLLKENSASISEDSEGVLHLLSRMPCLRAPISRTSEGMKNIGKISGFIGEIQPVPGSSAFYFLMYMGIMYSIGREHLEVVAS